MGLAIGGTLVAVWTLVVEVILPQQRMLLRGVFDWGVARLMLTGICYFFPNWRHASFACAALTLPAAVLILLFFPESPTWLHSKGRIEDMRKSERWIARIAGVEYKEEEKPTLVKGLSLRELIRNPQWLRRISVLWFMWFTAAISTFAIDLNGSTLSGDLFLNQLLFSIITMLSKNVLLAVDTLHPTFNRRNLHQYSQAIAILCAATLTLLLLFRNGQSVWMLVLNLIAILFLEYTWDACYLCSVESIPSNMRATSLGTCSLAARVGMVLSPVLTFLNSTWAPSAYLAVVLLGAVNLAISRQWLLETKGVKLDEVAITDADGCPSTDKHAETDKGERAGMLSRNGT
ncbi:solute carrier family 22 [Aphelenchoides avenae]|nr:solute carrier family 22 [Aphelenchus avenae]